MGRSSTGTLPWGGPFSTARTAGPIGGDEDAEAARPAAGFDVRAEVTDDHALRRGRAHPSDRQRISPGSGTW